MLGAQAEFWLDNIFYPFLFFVSLNATFVSCKNYANPFQDVLKSRNFFLDIFRTTFIQFSLSQFLSVSSTQFFHRIKK